MPTSTVENYVKQIYLQQQQLETELLPMGKVAAVMGVVPGTATSMVKALADSGLVAYEPRGGIRLTKGGEQLALHVLRRHRILELFLVDTLGLDWSEVHEEAETLEHAISDKVLDKMDQFLNHPQFDPHGDPIPSAKGTMQRVQVVPLLDCKQGQRVSIARVTDQDSAFLRFVERNGLLPGTTISLALREEQADAIVVKCAHNHTVTLGSNAAAKILVTTTPPADANAG